MNSSRSSLPLHHLHFTISNLSQSDVKTLNCHIPSSGLSFTDLPPKKSMHCWQQTHKQKDCHTSRCWCHYHFCSKGALKINLKPESLSQSTQYCHLFIHISRTCDSHFILHVNSALYFCMSCSCEERQCPCFCSTQCLKHIFFKIQIFCIFQVLFNTCVKKHLYPYLYLFTFIPLSVLRGQIKLELR